MNGKMIIFSAPSGAGKSSIVNYLLTRNYNLEFSISATTRPPRGDEKHGKEYYFMSEEEFKDKIANDEFVEYEEVYPGRFYGTLKSELERIWEKGNNVVFDVDVEGGVNLKKKFGDSALAVFIQPPSIEVLRERLKKRSTDSDEEIEKRIGKAAQELTYSSQFDAVIVSVNLEISFASADKVLTNFLK